MFVMPEVCVGGGALLFDLDSTVVSLAAKTSLRCLNYKKATSGRDPVISYQGTSHDNVHAVLSCAAQEYPMSFVNLLPLLSDTVFITAMYRLFSRGCSCSALGPGHRLNTGSAAADRAALAALLVAFIPFFSRGARFDVFSRRRTGCSASLLRKGNAAHEERRDRAKRQPQRSTNGHEVFLPFYAPFTNVEAGHWLHLDLDNPFH